jgi:formylmethanofuran dehydrogenase subunit B
MTNLKAALSTSDASIEQACPFCGLLCDDLHNEALTLSTVDSLSCKRAANGFRHALENVDTQARIRGKAATLDEAIAEAARILRSAKQPLIAGLATDVAGMQALMPIAEKIGAITDHMNSAVRRINSAAVQDTSGVYTTFAEARHRADVVVLCGGDVLQGFPRVFERVFPAQGEFLEGKPRTFISLGDEVTHRSYVGTNAQVHISAALPSTPESFIDIVSALHCELRGAPHTLKHRPAIKLIATALKEAKYPVFVWNAASFVQSQADLSARALLQLINTLNVRGRAAALMLGGSAGDGTTEAVHLWQSGSPWGSRFVNGVAQHDPLRTNAGALLAAREVDAMLWVDGLGAGQIPSAFADIPTIVIGQSRDNTLTIVNIPIGVSGVDHDAQLFRADRVVVVPLKALKRESRLPSVAQVARKLFAALNEGVN